jgi:hypothetical protein
LIATRELADAERYGRELARRARDEADPPALGAEPVRVEPGPRWSRLRLQPALEIGFEYEVDRDRRCSRDVAEHSLSLWRGKAESSQE